MAEAPYIIIGCGASKQPTRARAADLYTSSYIKCAVRWARSVTIQNRILILSAKHGLIRGSKIIEPHNVAFTKNPGGEAPVKDSVIAEQIAAFGLSGPVILLATPTYTKRLIAASRGSLQPYNPFFPVLDAKGLPHYPGHMAQAFIAWRGRIPSEGTA